MLLSIATVAEGNRVSLESIITIKQGNKIVLKIITHQIFQL